MNTVPDVAVHVSFGQEVLSSLPPEIRNEILPEPYTFALLGPDPWFMHRPWRRREGRGRQMHTTLPGRFLMALASRTRTASCRREMFSYLAGFLCHYALDSTAHPYIIRVTTSEYCFPRSHMSLEHALDAAQMKRDGLWGTAHPVTGRYFPALSLPACMAVDLDAVYEEVYGWKRCRKALNRACRLYRLSYRRLENPKGLLARLARLTGSPVLQSLAYSESRFLSLDAENTEHRPWNHSHDPSLVFTDSFPDLREKARLQAVEMITAAWRFIREEPGAGEALAGLVGNRSYLSGLPADDPRNFSVPSLLPSAGRPARQG